MDLDDLWRLLRCDDAVATGSGDDLVVGRVVTIDEGTACVSGCNARGAHDSRWCDPEDVRLADDAEAEMYRAWQGIELYRDVFPHARAWMDAHAFPSDAPDAPDEPAGDDVQTCEACAELEWPLYDVDGAMICGACAAGALEHERHTRHAEQAETLHHFTEQLRAYAAERDEARTTLARYTAVYGDPDAPVDVAHMFALEVPDERPLTGLALAADQMIKQTLAGVTPSVPEPPPRAGGALVTPLALAKVAALRCELDKVSEARDMAVYLMNRRQGEFDQMRATLARYTAVYADPDTPAPPPAADLSRCAPLPGMAEMADRILTGAVPDGVCVAKEIHDGTPLGLAIMRRQWKHLELAHDDWEVQPSPDAVALASMTRWQAELAAWQARELPCDDAGEQRWRLYAGVQEELGEVARCLLKGSQGIRGGAEVWRAQLPGEIGDVLVYLTQLATACGVDLGAAYAEARAKVLARRFATAEVAK